MEERNRIQVNLSNRLNDRLTSYCKRVGLSRRQVIETAISDYLDTKEIARAGINQVITAMPELMMRAERQATPDVLVF